MMMADTSNPDNLLDGVESVIDPDVIKQEEEMLHFMELVCDPSKIDATLDEASMEDANPNEINSRRVEIGERVVAPLMATTTVIAGVRTMSSKELEKGFSTDVDRRHVPYTNDSTRDGAIQRSIKLKILLDKAVTSGTHLEWEQMVDTGAVDNYMAMALEMKILT